MLWLWFDLIGLSVSEKHPAEVKEVIELIKINQEKIEIKKMAEQLAYLDQVPLGGFNYDNCLRNTALQS